jgi:probable phosphoglycerate mutase
MRKEQFLRRNKMRIIFIRHGEPDYEKDDLTETGIKQAELVAERLKDEGIDEIWSSTQGRALHTAKFTADLLGLPIKTTDFIREITWGTVNGEKIFAGGHPWDIADEMAKRGMDLNDPEWRSNQFFANNLVLECIDTVEQGIDQWLSELGYKRNGLYYDHLIEEQDHRTIAFFCHGGSSSAAIAHIMNLPFPYVCGMLHIEFTGITILRLDKTKGPCTLPCFELANDDTHVKEGYYHRLSDK